VGLTLAYFNFRHNAPLLMSSALSPLIGDRSKGWLGTGIDSLAVFGTIFGIATSLGLGATQITAGLSYSFDGIENNVWTQTIIVLIITVAFVISDRKSTRLNSSHVSISYAVFC